MPAPTESTRVFENITCSLVFPIFLFIPVICSLSIQPAASSIRFHVSRRSYSVTASSLYRAYWHFLCRIANTSSYRSITIEHFTISSRSIRILSPARLIVHRHLIGSQSFSRGDNAVPFSFWFCMKMKPTLLVCQPEFTRPGVSSPVTVTQPGAAGVGYICLSSDITCSRRWSLHLQKPGRRLGHF